MSNKKEWITNHAYMREVLCERIHESTQALEFVSERELLSMDDYEELVDIAEERIQTASDNEILIMYAEVA